MIMVIIIIIIIDMIQAGLEFDPGQQTVSVALYKCRLKVIKLVENLSFLVIEIFFDYHLQFT